MLSLCSGAGAADAGFGTYFDVVEAVEKWEDAARSHASNHRKTRVRCMDVLDYFAGRNDFTGIHGVLFTPPCQAHSILNRKKRDDDPRAQLTRKLVGLVASVQPEFVVINYPRLKSGAWR